jgi:hypothetical protein
MIELQTAEELIAEAHRLYDERLKSLLEPDHVGEFLALDVETGRYAVDRNLDVADEKLRIEGIPNRPVILRVGCDAAFDLHGR